MMRAAWMLLPALMLAGCEMEAGEVDPVADAEQPAAAGDDDPATSPAEPEAVKVSEETPLYSFDFSYPVEVAAIPELKERFDREMATAQDRLAAQAAAAQADARDQGFPYNAYAEGKSWQVVADTPRFLSLSAEIYSYTGGAHPNSGTTALVWDKETRRALDPIDFFTAEGALEEAVREEYCSALDKERTKRRGLEGADSPGQFGECPPLADLTVLLGSTNGRVFNRIGLVADPYVAGPYAEGDYDITVPVTEEVLAAVRPAYRSAFAAR